MAQAILTRNFDVLTKGAHMSLMNVMTELQKVVRHACRRCCINHESLT